MVDKVVNEFNQIWTEQDGDMVRIGFTRDFLNTLDQCWHILPAHNRNFKLKSPLMTVETNDGLVSILSPVTGFLQQFDKRAQNFPDRLTESDTIFHITLKEPVAPAVLPRGHGRYNDHNALPPDLMNAPDAEQVRGIQRVLAERELLALEARRPVRPVPPAPMNWINVPPPVAPAGVADLEF